MQRLPSYAMRTLIPLGFAHEPSCVGPFQPPDLADLRPIARLRHRDSRFYYDQNFSRPLCDRLYETWIENSTQGYAQAVLVGEHQARPAGYITCHCTAPVGQIGLFAVSQEAQGHGLGQELVLTALGWFKQQGASEVTAVTQGATCADSAATRNAASRRARSSLWYHYWPGLRASGGA